MTTDRSYRRGLTHERAIEILREYAGIQFDPRIVEIFANLPRHILTGLRDIAEESALTQQAASPTTFEAWEAV